MVRFDRTLVLPLVGLAICLAGCSSSPTLSSDGPPKGEVAVFGSIKFGSPGIKWTPGRFSLDVADAKASQPLFRHPLDFNDFYWHLPPGDYAITGLSTSFSTIDGSYSSSSNYRIYAEFTVPSVDGPVYIGELVWAQRQSRVNDELENALNVLRTKFPKLPQKITKSLLKLEEQK